MKTLKRVVVPGLDHEHDREHKEHEDLDEAEHHTGTRRRLHAAVDQEADQQGPQDREDPPEADRERRLLGVPLTGDAVAELQHDERDDEDLDGRVRPADKEAQPGSETDGAVGGNRAGGGNVLRQLADTDGGEEEADPGNEDGERKCATGECGAEGDGSGDGGAGGHRRDGLEQDVGQTDGIALQLGNGARF